MKNWVRFHKLLSDNQINKLQNTTVLVIGVGGVGSYAVEALARSGIKRLILVDYDIVDISNLNRQLIALNSTIGLKKVDVCENRINDINKNIEIIKICEKITKDNIDLLFNNHIDYLIDACDTIETKKEIIRQCLNRNIKFISSMGTGNKFDPSKLEITDIRKTSYDPIARIIRKMVKDEHINNKITVVSSTEKGINIHDRTPGSNSFVPSSSGLLCASYVINDILKEN